MRRLACILGVFAVCQTGSFADLASGPRFGDLARAAEPAVPAQPTAADLAPALSQMLGESMFREAQLRARLSAVSEQLEAETAHARQVDERIKALTPAPTQPAAPAATPKPAPSDTPAASAP